jgi:serine/threonine-protein kinase
MADLVDRLRAALADRYLIEHELGRGGMAIVYLAEDRKHQRRVALKVLRPELAASVTGERFLREITTAARLAHPNILPLFDSGEADGTLYYTMPYIEGESLRDRLNREKQLPIEDALRITKEVAEALGHAHEQGIVHRDMKPENILFQGGHALVADFGIARAVSAAGVETLTETGLAVGTPAYMSPEQASGSKDIDARSDLYSLGCVLYEMLAGEPPYSATTAQALIAKKLSEPLPRISVVREAVPAAVEAALTKALSKNGVDRFRTAADFAAALTAPAVTPPRQTRRLRSRVAMLGVLVIALVVSGAYGAWWFFATGRPGTLFGRGVIDPGDRVLLADFVNLTDDTTLAYAVSEGVRALLGDPRIVRLVDPANVRGTLARMGRAPDTRLDEPVAREVAERENAKVFVAGEVSRLGAGYQLTARVVQTTDGVELLRERVTARDLNGVIDAVDRLGGKLRRVIGESIQRALTRPSLDGVTTASLPALRAYSEARRVRYQGGAVGSSGRVLPLLDQAIGLDSTFAAALSFKSSVLLDAPGGAAEARALSERAYRLRDRLPELERLMVTGTYLHRRRDPAVEAVYHQVLDLDPTNDWALAGRSDWLAQQRRWAEAETLAVRGIEAGSQSVVLYFNAVEVQVAQRRFAAADSTLSRMLRQGLVGWWRDMRGHLLLARRDYDGAVAFADSLEHAPGSDAAHYVGPALVARGQLQDAFRRSIVAATRRARLYVRYAGDTARAVAEIEEEQRRLGWDTIPPARRRYDALIPALAEAGRIAEARRLLEECLTAAATDSNLAFDLPAYRSLIEGAVALAEGRLQSAAAAYLSWNTAPFLTSVHAYNQGLFEAGTALDRLGATDSALVLYERALNQPAFYAEGPETLWYPLVLRRLGELHESLGHREQAIDYYGQFIALWKDADPELQPQVEEARAALARLTGEPP